MHASYFIYLTFSYPLLFTNPYGVADLQHHIIFAARLELGANLHSVYAAAGGM